MSLKVNISGGPLDVPLLGRSVEAGEIVQVPDFQPAHTEAEPLLIVWPPDKWADAASSGQDDGTPDRDGAEEGTSGEGL